MSSPTLVHATSPSEPSPVVLGRDGTGKPRVSCFDAVSTDPATKAANLIKMRIMGGLATESVVAPERSDRITPVDVRR